MSKLELDNDLVSRLGRLRVSKAPVPSVAKEHARGIARLVEDERIVDEGDRYRVVKDIVFNTPSAASDLVLGCSSNGWDYWKDALGRTLHEVYRKPKG